MNMIFQVPGTPAVFLRNRDSGDVEIRDRGQAVGFTDGTAVFAYDVAVAAEVYRFSISNIPDDQKVAFQTWFDDVAQGVFKSFTVTIPRYEGVLDTPGPLVLTGCRFSEPALDWRNMGPGDGWWSVSFDVYRQTAGATGPPV